MQHSIKNIFELKKKSVKGKKTNKKYLADTSYKIKEKKQIINQQQFTDSKQNIKTQRIEPEESTMNDYEIKFTNKKLKREILSRKAEKIGDQQSMKLSMLNLSDSSFKKNSFISRIDNVNDLEENLEILKSSDVGKNENKGKKVLKIDLNKVKENDKEESGLSLVDQAL